MTASLVEVVVPVPPEGDGEGTATDALGDAAAALALGLGCADGISLGLGDGAAIVKVVVPRSISPSSADFVVQRTVYLPGDCGGTTRVIFLALVGSTVPPWATTAPLASTSLSELAFGSSGSVKVKTSCGGDDATVDLSAGLAVSSSA